MTTTISDDDLQVEAVLEQSKDQMYAHSLELLRKAEEAQIAYEASLDDLAHKHGSTFQQVVGTENGAPVTQWLQIRCRKDSVQGRPVTYLCKLSAEPKTWLSKKAKASKKIKSTEPAVLKFVEIGDHTYTGAAETQVVPEVGDSVVMD